MAFTWLHVSDLHIGDWDDYAREQILDALVTSLPHLGEDGWSPDLVFATGDIAHSGKASQYELATGFFDDLLGAVDLAAR